MTRVCQVGLAVEGSTDFDFLKPLLTAALEKLFIDEVESMVVLPSLYEIRPDGKPGNKPDDICALVLEEYPYLDVLLYHSDAGGKVVEAYETRVDVVASGLAGTPIRVVGVVPRREMEAWAIADYRGLCDVFGVEPAAAAVPAEFRPSRVESVTDPKAALQAFVESLPVRHYKADDADLSFLGALALSCDLDKMLWVPQFKRCYDDMRQALVSLEYMN